MEYMNTPARPDFPKRINHIINLNGGGGVVSGNCFSRVCACISEPLEI